MGGTGSFRKFLNIWLNKLTSKFNNYSCIPVAFHTSTNISSSAPSIMKLDSGASQHYIKPMHDIFLTNVTKTYDGPTIQLPNDNKLSMSHQGHLKLHAKLPPAATKAFILPSLKNKSLLSVGQLCNHNCTVEFGKYFCDIKHKNELILKGTRNFIDGLCDITLDDATAAKKPQMKLN